MNASKKTTALIKEAWAARSAGDTAKTAKLLASVESSNSNDPEILVEICLLKASLAWRDNRTKATADLFATAERIFETAELKPSAHFLLQKGLWRTTESDFTKALSLFMESARQAETVADELVARMNIVVCLYNLKLPLTKALRDVHALRARTHPHSELELRVQLIEQKDAFLRGDLEQVFEKPQKGLSQALFHQAWVARLPWAPRRRAVIDRFIEQSLASETFYQNEYRRQTILADPRWKESETPRIQDQVDRLYLWTWIWLKEPNSNARHLLAQELARFPFETATTSLTSEDFFMLRSLGGWLGLWNASFQRWFQNWIRKATPPEFVNPPLFELEDRLQRSLRGRVQIRQTLSLVRKKLPALADLVEKFADNLLRPAPQGGLIIDRARSSLKGQQEILSKPMAEILAALKESKSLTFEEALTRGFEISPYDDFVHAPKIHNLVQRMKTVVPRSCEIKTKNGVLYLADPDDELTLVTGSRHETFFPFFQAAPLPKKQSAQARFKKTVYGPAKLLTKFANNEILTREQIQETIGASKATTNRWIQTWLREGLLDQTGSGRATRYQIKR